MRRISLSWAITFSAMHIPPPGRTRFRFSRRQGRDAGCDGERSRREEILRGRDALGQHLIVDHAEKAKDRPLEIVGVVGNTRHESLAIEPIPEFYIPFAQDPDRRMYLLVLRTSSEKLTGLENSARGAIHEIDRDIYVPHLKSLEELIGINSAQPRFNMMLLGCLRRSRNDTRRDRNLRRDAYNRNATHERVRHRNGPVRNEATCCNDFASKFQVLLESVWPLASRRARLDRLMASLLYGGSAHDVFHLRALFYLSSVPPLWSQVICRHAAQ